MDMTHWMDALKESLVSWGPKVVAAGAILIIGYLVARIIAKTFGRAMIRADLDVTLVRFVKNLAFMMMMALVVIFGLGKLGIDTTSFAALIAAAGLAIGLALQGSLGNFASGVLIIVLRPFKVGDYVRIAGVRGTVDQVGVFATELTQSDNTKVIIPNGSVTSDNIINYTVHGTRRIDMVAGIGYGDDIRQAKAIFERILADHPKVLEEPAPRVAVFELADSSVNFVVRPWVKTEDYSTVQSDVTEQIKLELDRAGISIPYPQQDVHMHQVA
jgi:small conductance mechanosensitive channel